MQPHPFDLVVDDGVDIMAESAHWLEQTTSLQHEQSVKRTRREACVDASDRAKEANQDPSPLSAYQCLAALPTAIMYRSIKSQSESSRVDVGIQSLGLTKLLQTFLS